MKKEKPSTADTARASGKKEAVRNASVNPQANDVNLYEARGRYPLGSAWRLFICTISLREVLDILEDDGLTSIRLVASVTGTCTRGQQNNGSPALLLLDVKTWEVDHE